MSSGAKSRKPSGDDEQYQSQAVDIEQYPDLQDILPELSLEYMGLVADEKRIEARKKEISALVQPLFDAVGAKSVRGDGWTTYKSRGTNVQISKTKLLEKGVDIEVIEECTVRTPYYYIQVVKHKEE